MTIKFLRKIYKMVKNFIYIFLIILLPQVMVAGKTHRKNGKYHQSTLQVQQNMRQLYKNLKQKYKDQQNDEINDSFPQSCQQQINNQDSFESCDNFSEDFSSDKDHGFVRYQPINHVDFLVTAALQDILQSPDHKIIKIYFIGGKNS